MKLLLTIHQKLLTKKKEAFWSVISDECLVLFPDGEFAVANKCVYFKQGEKNDRTDNNNEDKGDVAPE